MQEQNEARSLLQNEKNVVVRLGGFLSTAEEVRACGERRAVYIPSFDVYVCNRQFVHDKPQRSNVEQRADNSAKIAIALKIVAALEKDISDRRGLKQEWEQISDITLDHIRADWQNIVLRHL